MRRGMDNIDFDRNRHEYGQGFGDFSKDYWLGNDLIHVLTNAAGSQLLRISTSSETQIYNQYDYFLMRSKTDDYVLSFRKHNGTSKTGEKHCAIGVIINTLIDSTNRDQQ